MKFLKFEFYFPLFIKWSRTRGSNTSNPPFWSRMNSTGRAFGDLDLSERSFDQYSQQIPFRNVAKCVGMFSNMAGSFVLIFGQHTPLLLRYWPHAQIYLNHLLHALGGPGPRPTWQKHEIIKICHLTIVANCVALISKRGAFWKLVLKPQDLLKFR